MSLAQMLQQRGVVTSMANELGIDERTAQTGVAALLPAIVAGMGRSTAGTQGLGGLGSVIGGLGGGGLLDAVLGSGATPTHQGNDILGNIFGNKDVSRSIAGEVSAITGIDEALLKKMLPILAMAVAGYMAKQATSGTSAPQGGIGGGALGGVLGSIVAGMGRR